MATWITENAERWTTQSTWLSKSGHVVGEHELRIEGQTGPDAWFVLAVYSIPAKGSLDDKPSLITLGQIPGVTTLAEAQEYALQFYDELKAKWEAELTAAATS